MEFRILGPLEVVEDGNSVALGTLKERLVLGVLLLHANELVSRERLIDDLWGEAPPPTARKAVNVYLSKLRKTLSVAGTDHITTASGGYRLNVEPERLDASRMRALVAEAQELVAKGEPERAAERFQEALALWRGPTLAGLQLESRGRDEVAQLDELRLTTLMDRIDCDLALGRHEQALGELGVLVREHPLRERLRAQQMLALYRAGRQADALEAYAEARRTLVDDLGIEPSEALQRLQQAILRHDPSLETSEGTTAVNGVPPTETAPPLTATDAENGKGPVRSRFRPRRWQLALAAIVILAGTGAAAAVLSSSARAHVGQVVSDSLVRIDPHSGSIVSVTPLEAAPENIDVTPTAIWTADFGQATASRYDLRTHHVLTVAVPDAPFNLAADARGDVWVSSLANLMTIKHFFFSGGGPLQSRNTARIRVQYPGAAAIALGSGYLWAIAGPYTTPGKDDLVSLVDPVRNKVIHHWRIGQETMAIALGDGAAWVAGFGSGFHGVRAARWARASSLTVIGPATQRPHTYRLENGDLPQAVAYGGGKVWVLTCGCSSGGPDQRVLEFDPAKHRVVEVFPVGTLKLDVALAFGAGYVWLTDRANASVVRLDPKTRRRRIFPVGNPRTKALCGIAATRNTVWVAVGYKICEDS
jgi:DNA-binding SARP family transcriptional activator/streptogramin lyase